MQNTKPFSIRIDDSLDERLTACAKKARIPKTEVMRIAIGLGLSDLESISCDISKAIYEQVKRAKGDLPPQEVDKITHIQPPDSNEEGKIVGAS